MSYLTTVVLSKIVMLYLSHPCFDVSCIWNFIKFWGVILFILVLSNSSILRVLLDWKLNTELFILK